MHFFDPDLTIIFFFSITSFLVQIIPGETDFRVFDEFANIPGYDFVLLDNGNVYHTTHDSIENVSPTGVYHGGRTVIELVMELAGRRDAIGIQEEHFVPVSAAGRFYDAAVKLSASLRLAKDPARPRAVFFDVLHLKTMVYDEGVAAMVNIIVLLVTLLIWIAKVGDLGTRDLIEGLRMFAVLLTCVPASFASATFASLVYAEVYNAKLRWYGDWITATCMFAPPAIFGTLTVLILLLPKRLSARRFEHMLFGLTLFLTVTAVGLMTVGFMTSYIPILLIVATNICVLQGEDFHPVIRHMELAIVHAVLGTKLITTSLSAILPLLGRARSENVPHDTIAALVVAYFTFTYLLQPSLPLLCYYRRELEKMQKFTFMISVAVGFWLVVVVPGMTGITSRSARYSMQAPKRIVAVHFYSAEQEPHSIFALGTQDPIEMDVDRICSTVVESAHRSQYGTKLPVWGSLNSTAFETFRPFKAFVQDLAVFNAQDPPDLPLPTARVLSSQEDDTLRNVTIIVQALDSHQLTVSFPVGKHSAVVDWSVQAPLKDLPGGAWIRHVGSVDFKFWVVLRKQGSEETAGKLRMSITSGRLGVSRSPKILSKLVFEKHEAPAYFVSTGVELVV